MVGLLDSKWSAALLEPYPPVGLGMGSVFAQPSEWNTLGLSQ